MAPPSMPARTILAARSRVLACSSLPARISSTRCCQSSAGSAGCAPLPLRAGRACRAGVAEIAAQQLDDIVDQLLRLGLADIGQIIARDVGRIAERPGIRLAGVRMNAGDDDLLAVAQEFDFLAGAAVGGDQVGGDLGEWISGAKRNRALRRLADARQDTAALFKPFAYQFLDCDRGGLVENIGVERRRELGQNAGIVRARPVSAPRLQHRMRHVLDLLPALERRHLCLLPGSAHNRDRPKPAELPAPSPCLRSFPPSLNVEAREIRQPPS